MRSAARRERSVEGATAPRADASSSAAQGRNAPLARTVSWPAAVVVALGTTLLVTVSLGPMAAELGNASALVWIVTAGVGALQCLVISELAQQFSDRAAGTAMYAHEILGRSSLLPGALSSWGYWLAWTPGIAVNLILAASYLRSAVWPNASNLAIALAILALLYGVNALGLRFGMAMGYVLAALAVVPLAAITLGLVLHPSVFRMDTVLPVRALGRSWTAAGTWALVLKWMFVAAWSSYGAEMASTVVAEMRNPARTIPRAMRVSAVIGLLGFGVFPVLLIGALDADAIAREPSVALHPAAALVFGTAGARILSVMLAAALVLGAHAFVVGSSRTIYQMARDGYLPTRLGTVNRFGVPIGSVALDAVVIAAFLTFLGAKVVDIVAAANVGYLAVFVLLPISYLMGSPPRSAWLSGRYRGVAIALLIYNVLLLTVGGYQWGWKVVGVGAAALLLIVPIAMLSHRYREETVRRVAAG